MGRKSKLAVSHRDTEAAEAEEKKGKGWVLSGPNPFLSSGLRILSTLCVKKLARRA
jgi:hypothetical protein